jgi:hypothetical protein
VVELYFKILYRHLARETVDSWFVGLEARQLPKAICACMCVWGGGMMGVRP